MGRIMWRSLAGASPSIWIAGQRLTRCLGPLGVLWLLGCSAAQQASGPAEFATHCQEPRPEICTREYVPVCATRDNGVRCVTEPCDATETATYGNACSACADPAVYHHRPGACDQAEP